MEAYLDELEAACKIMEVQQRSSLEDKRAAWGRIERAAAELADAGLQRSVSRDSQRRVDTIHACLLRAVENGMLAFR